MRDLVQPAETVVGPDTDLQEMSRLFLQHPVKYLYVVDAQSLFLGVVPLKALSAAADVPGIFTAPPSDADVAMSVSSVSCPSPPSSGVARPARSAPSRMANVSSPAPSANVPGPATVPAIDAKSSPEVPA